MSKDKFSWKSLFVNESPESFPQSTSAEPVAARENNTTFPVSEGMHTIPPGSTVQNNPFIPEILAVYENGVESLNLEGFDFFEMYKSVIAVGVTNPQSYTMAFTMGKTIKSDLTKELLLDKSRFYIDEIEKVFVQYDTIGNKRKMDLDTSITRDKVNLTKEISDLETKLVNIQRELEEKRKQLASVDASSHGQYNEIHLKMEANKFAKNTIIESINSVVTGINQYL